MSYYLKDIKRYHIIMCLTPNLIGRNKGRLVTGWPKAPDVEKNNVYSGVVSIETIIIAFVLAAMNKLEVCAADVSIEFLYRKTREKVYVIAGK